MGISYYVIHRQQGAIVVSLQDKYKYDKIHHIIYELPY